MIRFAALLCVLPLRLSADAGVVRVGAAIQSSVEVTVDGWSAFAEVMGAEPRQAVAAVVLPSGEVASLGSHVGEWVDFGSSERSAYAAR